MNPSSLELDDIQSGVLRPRPNPYVASYLLFRIDDADAGREFIRRVRPIIASAAHSLSPAVDPDTWVSLSLTYQGLKALGVPDGSLASFAPEFKQGMAARASHLGDTGDNSPEFWEKPLGTGDVHIVLTGIAPDRARLDEAIGRAREVFRGIQDVHEIWHQECHAHADGKEAFGFKDGIGHPAIEGSGIPGTNTHEAPLKPGEFVLGYEDEFGGVPAFPQPEILGRNGSYIVFRKLHQRVAEFRRYLKSHANSTDHEELLAAKMMGRWRSGAPLALCPHHDDPTLGQDDKRNNDFLFKADDPIGYKTPSGCHIRRMNPRDSDIAGLARIHRMIRRGTSYGPPLPEGQLEDDGVERGLMFAFVGANLGRQFEFVQSEWMNDSAFFGGAKQKDPIAGAQDEDESFDFPQRPLKRRLSALPRFVSTRGGEYAFMPGLKALQWLGDLETDEFTSSHRNHLLP